jgi:GNAT superfamily N-acetyltransferase
MFDVEIRLPIATDLSHLAALDHSCESEFVWQLELQKDVDQVGVVFRQVRLPRSVQVFYPRPVEALADDWKRQAGMLVAVSGEEPVGYVRMDEYADAEIAWLTDLVVAHRVRRQGVGRALVLAAHDWAVQRSHQRVIMEMTSKSYAAIRLVQSLGYEFCGYNDQYYSTQDIALFFGRSLK